jgi:hypothetical protein
MRLSYRLVVLWLPGENLLLNLEDRLEALSSEVLPMHWTSWDTSVGTLSDEVSVALWHEVRERVSLANLVGLLALSHSVVSLGLVTKSLVAVESVVLEGDWASVGAN